MRIVYKKGISIILVMLMVFGGFSGSFVGGGKAYAADGFAAGTGTQVDPYQIATAADLDLIRNHLDEAGRFFKLTSDINLTNYLSEDGAGYNDGDGWVPINDFNGNIDGDGHIIMGLMITRLDTNNVGLFGSSGGESSIKDLNLQDVHITSQSFVGGLVGVNAGTISNSSVTGIVNGDDTVGGLVGWNDGGEIEDSYSAVVMNGNPGHYDLGGLVGYNRGTISNSYATGNVTGSFNVGGLAGHNYDSGSISNSYATGSVTGIGNVGGLVGADETNGTITNSFYDSDKAEAGQLYNDYGTPKTTIEMKDSNTFSGWNFDSDWYMLIGQYPQLWAVTTLTMAAAPTSAMLTVGTDNVGSTKLSGLTNEMEYKVNTGSYKSISDTIVDDIEITVGDLIYVRVKATATQLPSKAQILNVEFADIKSAGSITSQDIAGVIAPVAHGTPISSISSTAQYRASIVWSPAVTTFAPGVTYTATITITPIHGYTFTGVTRNYFTVEGASTTNSAQAGVVTAVFPATATDFAGGSGTMEDPYQIATAAQLDNVRLYLDWSFKLIKDIDLTEYLSEDGAGYNDGDGWMPIGNWDNEFSGSFDGSGFIITNLTINRPGVEAIGLFGYMNRDSLVTNTILDDILVSGGNGTGGLVGQNDGTISNSYIISGTVSGVDGAIIGGLVGGNNGSINNSSVITVDVNGDSYVGGLVGYNESNISNSYSAGDVNGDYTVGGLVGSSEGTISNSYARGRVIGINSIGGLVGDNYNEINSSYATGYVDGVRDLGGLIGYNEANVIDSFYDYETTGQEDIEKGTGLSSDDMWKLSTYFGAHWDMAHTWRITPSLNDGYPILQDFDYIVTYDGNGNGNSSGSAPVDSTTYSPGITASVYGNTGNLMKTGFTFMGWNTLANGNGISYTAADTFMLTTNKTLYAKWLSNDATLTLTSTIGTVSSGVTANETITNISNGTTLDALKAVITPAANATFEVYDADRTTIATTLATGKKVIVTAQDGTTKVTYTVTVNAALSNIATLTSTIGTVSTGVTATETITNIPNGTTLAALKAAITPAANTTYEVYDADGITVATALATGKKVIVTAQDGTTQVTYTVTVNGPTATPTPTPTPTPTTTPTTPPPTATPASTPTATATPASTSTPVTSTPASSTPIPTATPTVLPTATPTPISSIPTATPKPFYNELVNLEVIKALVEKANSALAITFKDVPKDSPAAKTIELATKLGIIKGYADGSFQPKATVTRAEFATMLVKALGLTSKGDSSFKDTKGHWAAEAIATLKSSGIINGYADGSFKPNQSISKAEIVAMLSKVMSSTTPSNPTKFSDVSGSWAEDAINQLTDSGIVKGTSDGSFKPNAKATRAESLLLIMRLLNASLGYSLDIE